MADTAEITTARREVLAVFVTYKTVRQNLLGEKRIVPATAYRGDTVELGPDDEARLDALGALVPKDSGLSAQQIVDGQVERALARAINPLDRPPLTESVQVSVSPPGLGAAPAGGGSSEVETQPPSVQSDSELIEFVSNNNVTDVVAAAGDDPALAARLLDAERAAAGDGEPRKTVVEGLEKVAGQ